MYNGTEASMITTGSTKKTRNGWAWTMLKKYDEK